MTQNARPNADISLGTWTNPTWSVIDDDSDSDSSDSGNVRSGAQTAELGLIEPTDPVSSSDHIIRFRAKYTTNGDRVGGLNVQLYEGTTLRAQSATQTLSTSFAEYTYTLSGAEADSLTYTDMRFKLVASMVSGSTGLLCNVQCSSARLDCPDAPAAAGQPMMLRATNVPGMRQWTPGRR